MSKWLTRSEERALILMAIYNLIVLVIGIVVLAPFLFPIVYINKWMTTVINMNGHPLFIILIYVAANITMIAAFVVVFVVTPGVPIKVGGAIIYAIYGFWLVANLTNDNQEWSLKSMLPTELMGLITPIQGGDIVWSVAGSIVAGAFGWFLFGYFKEKSIEGDTSQ